MNDIDIEEGRRLAEAATPGQWHIELAHGDHGSIGYRVSMAECDSFSAPAEPLIEEDAAFIVWLRNNAAAMFDAIETGRQWETIARRLAEGCRIHATDDRCAACTSSYAAFCVLADRTPTPTDGGS